MTLAKKPLTDRAIASLKPPAPGKRRLVWDSVVPGLALRITDTGARSFVFVKRFPNIPNPTARAICKYGALSLEDVRETARQWGKSILGGVDPQRAAEHAAKQAAQDTLKAVCEEYQGKVGKDLRSFRLRQSALDRLVYPILGSLPIGSIKKSDVVRLMDKIEAENGPHQAVNTRKLLSTIFAWHSGRSDDFTAPIMKGIAKHKKVARERILTDDELRAIWQATYSGSSHVFGRFVRFLLLTGCRRQEAAQLEWSEIAGNVWTLPASRNKTGVELARPLSRAALKIIMQMVPGLQSQRRFVFTRSGDAGIGGFTPLKAALDKASGTSGWTLHDLRRTSRSLMSRAGVSSEHAERCLGHVIGGVEGVYNRHRYIEEMERAYEMLATLISRIVEGPSANVVAIRGQG
jgi:integrase